MLSRPHTAPSSTADRAQVAALFGMLGLGAGVVIVAALAWLYALSQQMHDQSLVLGMLGKSVEETEQVQKLALDTLLAKTDEGRDPRRFVENYQKVQKDLDLAKEAVKDKDRLTTLAVLDNRRLEKELESIKLEKLEALEKAQAEREGFELQREKARELKSELDSVYKTPQGELSKKYSISLYAAITGWAFAVLASLGLVVMWLSKMPQEDEMPPRTGSITGSIPGKGPNGPALSEEPPHQIL